MEKKVSWLQRNNKISLILLKEINKMYIVTQVERQGTLHLNSYVG